MKRCIIFLLITSGLLIACRYEEDRIAGKLEGRWKLTEIGGDTLNLVRPDTADFLFFFQPCDQAYTAICRVAAEINGHSGKYLVKDTLSFTIKSNEITMITPVSTVPNYQLIWRSRRYRFEKLENDFFELIRYDYPSMYIRAQKLE